MGGRKSARVEKIVGNADYLKKDKQAFLNAVKSQEPKKIVSSAVQYFSESKQVISNLSKAAKLLDFISENKNKKEASYQDRKEEVTQKWSQIKKDEKLETSSSIDRILIESATKVIRRGKK